MSIVREPISTDQLFAMLDKERIDYQRTDHPPLRTVEDAKALRTGLDSDQGHIKNLFLHDKKRRLCLFTLHEDTSIDLKAAAQSIGARRFSFCSPDRLMQYLGVIPGAVSPLALLNDRDCEVEFYFDKLLMAHEVIHVHPLDNRITVTLNRVSLLDLLDKKGHPYQVWEHS